MAENMLMLKFLSTNILNLLINGIFLCIAFNFESFLRLSSAHNAGAWNFKYPTIDH